MSVVDTVKNLAVGNADGSVMKTAAPSIAQKKSAINPIPSAIVETKKIFPTEGFSKFPIVVPASVTAADFYRRGQAILGPTADGSVNYNVQPRAITSFADDEEPASIRLVGKLKKGSKMEDADLLPPFTKFFLENVAESHQERSQIVETFGDFYVFFFGERPPIYTFTGTFVNTKFATWTQDFMFYYDKYIRGTRCVENDARIVLTYGGRQVEGFILSVSTSTAAQNDNSTSFSFQTLIIDRKIMQLSADFGLTVSNDRFANSPSFLDKLAKLGLAQPEISKAWNATKAVMDGKTNPASSSTPAAASAIELGKEYGKALLPSSVGGLKLPL